MAFQEHVLQVLALLLVLFYYQYSLMFTQCIQAAKLLQSALLDLRGAVGKAKHVWSVQLVHWNSFRENLGFWPEGLSSLSQLNALLQKLHVVFDGFQDVVPLVLNYFRLTFFRRRNGLFSLGEPSLGHRTRRDFLFHPASYFVLGFIPQILIFLPPNSLGRLIGSGILDFNSFPE